jgi:hypothetical protein
MNPVIGTRKSIPGAHTEKIFPFFHRAPVGIKLKNAAWFILSLRCAPRIFLPADPAGLRSMRLSHSERPLLVLRVLLLCGGKWTNCNVAPCDSDDLEADVAESSHFPTQEPEKTNPAQEIHAGLSFY